MRAIKLFFCFVIFGGICFSAPVKRIKFEFYEITPSSGKLDHIQHSEFLRLQSKTETIMTWLKTQGELKLITSVDIEMKNGIGNYSDMRLMEEGFVDQIGTQIEVACGNSFEGEPIRINYSYKRRLKTSEFKKRPDINGNMKKVPVIAGSDRIGTSGKCLAGESIPVLETNQGCYNLLVITPVI